MRVALIGASGYGNIGDDTYPLVWSRYFPTVDWRIYNSDLPSELPKVDLVLFGGGGLIYNNRTAHFDYMRRYIDWALASRTPYGFLSCGIQAAKDKSGNWMLIETLTDWIPLLRNAIFIGLRDPMSRDALWQRGIHHAYYAPDLCYLFPGNHPTENRYVTVCPAASVNAKSEAIIERIELALKDYPSARLISINMGAVDSDDATEAFTDRFDRCKVFCANDLTPGRALSLIASSATIITGRFHGLVFARALRRPAWYWKGKCQWKLEHECLDVDPKLALRHLKKFSNWSGIEFAKI